MDHTVISRLSTYLIDGARWTKDLLATDLQAAIKLIESYEELDLLQMTHIRKLGERVAELERENEALKAKLQNQAAKD